MHFIYGINAVAEALKARGRSFEWVGVAKDRHDLRLQRVIDESRRNGIAVRFVPRAELDRDVARASPREHPERQARGNRAMAGAQERGVILLGAGDAAQGRADRDPEAISRHGPRALAHGEVRIREREPGRGDRELGEPIEARAMARTDVVGGLEVRHLARDPGAKLRGIEPR